MCVYVGHGQEIPVDVIYNVVVVDEMVGYTKDGRRLCGGGIDE